jgi:DNA-3-methyladenine glycosylase I
MVNCPLTIVNRGGGRQPSPYGVFLAMNTKPITRCPWPKDDPLYLKYHDEEWGVPVHDDRKLFEFLVLEGAQAGLSWITILRKREAYRKAFDNFDVKKVAKYDRRKIAKLMKDAGIVRNRLKIESAVHNAKLFMAVQKELGSFDSYMWQFVGGKPIVNHWRTIKEIPCKSAESDAMSKDLKARGFKFVGTLICYAHMQAVGMINDHLVECFRYKSVS